MGRLDVEGDGRAAVFSFACSHSTYPCSHAPQKLFQKYLIHFVPVHTLVFEHIFCIPTVNVGWGNRRFLAGHGLL